MDAALVRGETKYDLTTMDKAVIPASERGKTIQPFETLTTDKTLSTKGLEAVEKNTAKKSVDPVKVTKEDREVPQSLATDARLATGDTEPTEKKEVGEEADSNNRVCITTEVAAKKRKRKGKSKAGKSKGQGKPTGFEDYYADAPLTPDEHEEELALYDPQRSFTERLETAIQRYNHNRKFDSDRRAIFDKYLSFGGVDTGPRTFTGGMDLNTINAGATTADIVQLTATHFLNSSLESGEESEHHVVDFDAVAKGFFSSRVPQCIDTTTKEAIKTVVSVVRNFLNYLLHHDVCPEYNYQINAARKTCDQAEIELWACHQASVHFPGNFNRACSTIFGGYYSDSYVGDNEEAIALGCDPGMSPATAQDVIKAGLAAQGDDDIIRQYQERVRDDEACVVDTHAAYLEVAGIELASEQIHAVYDHPVHKDLPLPKVLGRLRVRTWVSPNAPVLDLTAAEEAELLASPTTSKEYTLWLEDDILKMLIIGLRFEVNIHRTNFGVWYIDRILGAYCTFYTLLPNELLIGWKPHKQLERPSSKDKDGIKDDEEETPQYEEEDDEANANKWNHAGKQINSALEPELEAEERF